MLIVKKSFFLLLIIFLLYSLIKNVLNYQSKLQFYESFKEDYLKEKKQNITLKTQVLKNKDPGQIEKTIRNKLNLLKPDEVAIILPQPTPTPILVTPTPLPNWLQWWQVIVKKNY